jgi:hypothetical protein
MPIVKTSIVSLTTTATYSTVLTNSTSATTLTTPLISTDMPASNIGTTAILASTMINAAFNITTSGQTLMGKWEKRTKIGEKRTKNGENRTKNK